MYIDYFLRIVAPIISFISLLYIGNHSTDSEFGVYSVYLIYATLANIVFYQFMKRAAIRFLVETEKDKGMFLCFFIISIFLAAGSAFFDLELIFIIVFSIAFYEILSEYLLSKSFRRVYVFLLLLRTLLFLTLLFFKYDLLLFDLSLSYCLLLSYFFTALIGFLYVLFIKKKIEFKVDVNIITEMLKFSLPMLLAALFSFLVDYADKYFLNLRLGVDVMGGYAYVFSIAQQSVGSFMFAIYSMMYTNLVISFEKGEPILKEWLSWLSVSVVLFLLGLIAFFVVGDVFFNGLLDKQIDYTVLTILLISSFVFCVRIYFLDVFFYLYKRTNYILVNSVLSGTVSVFLAFSMVYFFGALGAALSFFVVSVFSFFISFYFIKRKVL